MTLKWSPGKYLFPSYSYTTDSDAAGYTFRTAPIDWDDVQVWGVYWELYKDGQRVTGGFSEKRPGHNAELEARWLADGAAQNHKYNSLATKLRDKAPEDLLSSLRTRNKERNSGT